LKQQKRTKVHKSRNSKQMEKENET
jgi:hypothetical protein